MQCSGTLYLNNIPVYDYIAFNGSIIIYYGVIINTRHMSIEDFNFLDAVAKTEIP
jgi:hypothetical protein